MQNMLKAPITMNELTKQVFKKHDSSATGMSGVTYVLMQEIWPIIKHAFLRMASRITSPGGSLPNMEKIRKIIVISKPDNDRTHPDSYRPICLLEVTYKIMSGVFADRLRLIMPLILPKRVLHLIEQHKTL